MINDKKEVFISHASEDKPNVVIPFVKELDKYGISYWLDSKEILPGDSMTDKIFKDGIGKTTYFVVFLSRNFLSKGWTNAELKNALAKQTRTNSKIVIPFLVDLSFSELIDKFPEFENIFCGNLDRGIEDAAYTLSKIINHVPVLSRYNESLFKRHELSMILNWYDSGTIENIGCLSKDELVSTCSHSNLELFYSYVFSVYNDSDQIQFVKDRLNCNVECDPTESFLQLSLIENSSFKDKNYIENVILSRYPSPNLNDFESVRLPNKEDTFFKKIPAGKFIFGADKDSEFTKPWISKPTEIYLSEYFLSTTPITNAQYKLFMPNNSIRLPDERNNDLLNHPVVNVSWYDAIMFTIWLSQAIPSVTLPTEFQWEKGASWSEKVGKMIFPWGNHWHNNLCNSWYDGAKKGTTPVGSFEDGKSPYGLYDMSGNVWEWCSDWFSDDWYKYFSSTEEKCVVDPTGPFIGRRKVDRGGGWYYDVGMPTVYMRAGDELSDTFRHCGFRVAKIML